MHYRYRLQHGEKWLRDKDKRLIFSKQELTIDGKVKSIFLEDSERSFQFKI